MHLLVTGYPTDFKLYYVVLRLFSYFYLHSYLDSIHIYMCNVVLQVRVSLCLCPS